MERLVQRHVAHDEVGRPVRDDDIQCGARRDERLELVVGDQSLGGKAGRGSLEDAAQLDGVDDLGVRESANDEPPAVERVEEPLVREGR